MKWIRFSISSNFKNLSINWKKYVFYWQKWNFEHIEIYLHTGKFLALGKTLLKEPWWTYKKCQKECSHYKELLNEDPIDLLKTYTK